VVVAHALYLPSAQCFALLPLASQLGRTGSGNGCSCDFDTERGRVVVSASGMGFRCAAARRWPGACSGSAQCPALPPLAAHPRALLLEAVPCGRQPGSARAPAHARRPCPAPAP
jgi:hypothetical protein